MLRRHLGTILVLAVLLGLLGGVLWIMFGVWTHIDAKMSVHGWIALVLGVVFSFAVGIGLMGLMFYSSRRGYDEPPTFK
jgi:cation transporter-like permease